MTSTITRLTILISLLHLSSNALAATSKPNITEYEVIEIREGEFQPTNKDGSASDQKYSAYFMSLESESEEDLYKKANYNYVGIKGGAVMPTNLGGSGSLSGQAPDGTYTLGFVAGHKFLDLFAVEFEYAHYGNNTVNNTTSSPLSGEIINTWGAKSNIFMINASADLIKGKYLRPYVKAGLGLSRNDASNFIETTAINAGGSTTETYNGLTTNEFAWQAGVGLNLIINSSFDSSIEYMYVDHGKIKTAAAATSSANGVSGSSQAQIGYLRANVITLSLKYKF